ncbi:MAG: DUF3501 family protein [Nannocystaceae bacterium]
MLAIESLIVPPEPCVVGHPKGLGPAHVLCPSVYERARPALRARVIALKRLRRVRIDPCVVLLFENRETVRMQIQEVLRAEGHTPRRVQQELERYACLLPPAGELRATAMVDGGTADRGRRLARALRRDGAVRLRRGGASCGSTLARDDGDDDDAVQYLRFAQASPLGCSPDATSLEITFEHGSRVQLTAPPRVLLRQLLEDLRPPPPRP